MKYAYVCRMGMHASTVPGWYLIKYVSTTPAVAAKPHDSGLALSLEDAQAPVRRRRSDGEFSWDYANQPMKARRFHREHPNIRLKPGEGPILVDLDDTETKRTSMHPEDLKR